MERNSLKKIWQKAGWQIIDVGFIDRNIGGDLTKKYS